MEIEVTLDDENESPAIGAIVEYVYDDGTNGFGGVDDQVAMLKNIKTHYLINIYLWLEKILSKILNFKLN